MANPPTDQGIPLLTEVIGPQSTSEAAPMPALAPARSATSAASPAPAPLQSPAAPDMVNLSPAPMPRPAVAPATASVSAPPHSGLNPPPVSVAPSPAESAASPSRGITPGTLSQSTAAATPGRPRTEAVPAEKADSADSAAPAGTWSDSELRDLENELRLRITRQVLGRIDFVLDHRVRNSVTEVVDAAIDTLAAEIKRGLHETLTDIVARAVAQEISRLQSGKK